MRLVADDAAVEDGADIGRGSSSADRQPAIGIAAPAAITRSAWRRSIESG
jgi:hypothetical protein